MGRNQERDERVRAIRKQNILETAFSVFAEKGIDTVSMNEIAEACGISYATLYRNYSTKAELVLAVNSRIWADYFHHYHQRRDVSKMNAAEEFDFYLDSFLDMFRNYRAMLRFTQYFNVYIGREEVTPQQMQVFYDVVKTIADNFHGIYVKAEQDGTLRTDIPEDEMFSATMHLMLAAVTRYSVGLVYQNSSDIGKELILLKELLLSYYRV
jgi:AcrR family transcriptional regulator